MFGQFKRNESEKALTKLAKQLHPILQVVEYDENYYMCPEGIYRREDLLPLLSIKMEITDLYSENWTSRHIKNGRFKHERCCDEIQKLCNQLKLFHEQEDWRKWKTDGDKLPWMPFTSRNQGFRSGRKRLWFATGHADAAFFCNILGFGHLGYGLQDFSFANIPDLIRAASIFDYVWLDFRTLFNEDQVELRLTCCERVSKSDTVTRWNGPIEDTFCHFKRSVELLTDKILSQV
jgi:hypothetical protein